MNNYFFKIPFFLLLFLATNLFGSSQEDLPLHLGNKLINFEINPEYCSIHYLSLSGTKYLVSQDEYKKGYSGLKREANRLSWSYPESGLEVSIVLAESHLDISFTAQEANRFVWPNVISCPEAFTIPFHQGKYIPATDSAWIRHLCDHGPFGGSQDLSMQFFATNFPDQALLYVIKNSFNNSLIFDNNSRRLSLSVEHEIPATAENRQFGFRIYPVTNDITEIASTYRDYIHEEGTFLSLKDKAEQNPDVRKLYGAPHIYLWNAEFLVREDIKNWIGFKNSFLKASQEAEINPARHILRLIESNGSEFGNEFINSFNEFENNEYDSKYMKNLFLLALGEVLSKQEFFQAEAWHNFTDSPEIANLLDQGIDKLSLSERYRLNKLLLYAVYGEFLDPIEEWGAVPLSLINDIYDSGIKEAWLGLNNWQSAAIHPEAITRSIDLGYLIGTYDSYHSIHEPGNEMWRTAAFDDTTLYDLACIRNEENIPISGFLGQGRKLNPTLSFLAVKNRMEKIMKEDLGWNSWFIDCDATGEFFDDFTPGRMTGQKEDMEARLKRMAWIRDTYNLVIGSEVGNDFSSRTIAFAHGMTTPVVAWEDPDMRENKESEYYTGSYFAARGIPGRYVLQAPLKAEYIYLYFDNRFNIPLFQLVYNNSVITSHHWEWGSLKVPSQIRDTQLKEILYNVPPLYHLDQNQWKQNRDVISKHVRTFSKLHEFLVELEMTEFQWITDSRLVQKSMFGDSLEIVANFSLQAFTYRNVEIPGKSLAIHYLDSGSYEVYSPGDSN